MKIIRTVKTVGRYLTHSDKAASPIVAYLMVTKNCNLRCKMCSYWKGIYKSQLDTEQVKVVIDKLAEAGVSILSITGGEPCTRQDICEILDYAKWTAEIEYVRLQTNGTLLNQKIIRSCLLCADDIWLSIDGVGRVHDRIRGVNGTFARIEKNVDLLNQMRGNSPNLNLIMNCVVNRYNYLWLDEIRELARKWCAQRLFFHKVANIKDETYHSRQFSSEEDIGEATYYPDRKGCLLLYTNVMVNPEGFMIPCGILDKLPVGNLLDNSFEEIWNGRAMIDVRRMVWNGLEVCKHCCVPNTSLKSRVNDTFNMWRII